MLKALPVIRDNITTKLCTDVIQLLWDPQQQTNQMSVLCLIHQQQKAGLSTLIWRNRERLCFFSCCCCLLSEAGSFWYNIPWRTLAKPVFIATGAQWQMGPLNSEPKFMPGMLESTAHRPVQLVYSCFLLSQRYLLCKWNQSKTKSRETDGKDTLPDCVEIISSSNENLSSGLRTVDCCLLFRTEIDKDSLRRRLAWRTEWTAGKLSLKGCKFKREWVVAGCIHGGETLPKDLAWLWWCVATAPCLCSSPLWRAQREPPNARALSPHHCFAVMSSTKTCSSSPPLTSASLLLCWVSVCWRPPAGLVQIKLGKEFIYIRELPVRPSWWAEGDVFVERWRLLTACVFTDPSPMIGGLISR